MAVTVINQISEIPTQDFPDGVDFNIDDHDSSVVHVTGAEGKKLGSVRGWASAVIV